MKLAASLLAALLSLAASAWAQDQAFTNRSTPLREKGAADAKTLATLPADTSVKVVSRAGGWTQVQANNQTGWVNAFHLRFPVTTEKASGGGLSAVTSIFGSGNRSSQATIGTTGIRGLDPEQLKNASPDNAALAKAQGYRADKPAAERFAREGKLVEAQVSEGGTK